MSLFKCCIFFYRKQNENKANGKIKKTYIYFGFSYQRNKFLKKINYKPRKKLKFYPAVEVKPSCEMGCLHPQLWLLMAVGVQITIVAAKGYYSYGKCVNFQVSVALKKRY